MNRMHLHEQRHDLEQFGLKLHVQVWSARYLV